MQQSNQSTFHRFQIYTARSGDNGEVLKEKSVGFALLREGQDMYNLKLWTFPNEKYYLIPAKDDSSKFLIMTREERKIQDSNRKYNWSIVGNGMIYSNYGVVQLNFDLLAQPIFMNTTPDKSPITSQNQTLSVA